MLLADFGYALPMSTTISVQSCQSLFVTCCFNEIEVGQGTAFVAKGPRGSNFLLTNRHVVTGRDNDTGKVLHAQAAIPRTLKVMHNAVEGVGTFVERTVPLYGEGDAPLWIEHPSYPTADLVALKIPNDDGIVLHPYEINALALGEIEPGSPVYVVGFPFGVKSGQSFAVWSTGFVASEPEINHDGMPVFLIDCRSRQGQSGSPVIVLRGGHGNFLRRDERHTNVATTHVLGIYSGRIRKDSDLGRVWKCWLIAELLAAAEVA